MPDFDMWGPAQSGFRLAEQDTLAKAATIARTQHEQALAQEAQQRVEEQRRLTQVMSQLSTPDGQGGPANGGSLADILESQATKLSSLGFPAKAGDLGVRAATIRMHEAQTEHQQSAADALDAATELKRLDRAAQLFSSAKDQPSWDAANMMFAQEFPDQRNPFAGIPYSPQAQQAALAQALSVKDRMHLQQTGANVQSEIKLRDAREGYLNFRKELLTRQEDDRERRTDALVKQGGSRTGGAGAAPKPINAPTTGELKAASSFLDGVLPNKLPTNEQSNAAYAIASEAKRLVKETPGLSPSEALNRAYAANQSEFETVSKTIAGFETGKQTRYLGTLGMTPDKPRDPPPDRKFKAGRYYNTPKGVLLFTGTGWRPLSPAQVPSRQSDDTGEE